MRSRTALPAAVLLLVAAAAPVRGAVIDDFTRPERWRPQPADGVRMQLSEDAGALRVDFQFERGAGWAVLHRDLRLSLPSNYRFRFRVRGATGPENLEFKLIDTTGANVWWCNRRGFAFPRDWQSLVTRKRQIAFAWGPQGGGEPTSLGAIEFAITAGSGGHGTVWLDQLELDSLPPADRPLPPLTARASSAVGRIEAEDAAIGAWRSAPNDRAPWLIVDAHVPRELSAVQVDWSHAPAHWALDVDDGGGWQPARAVSQGRNPAVLHLPDREALRLRVRALSGVPAGGIAMRRLAIESPDWAPTRAALVQRLAAAAPRGRYPRAFAGEQPFWTVVGREGADDRPLLGEDGALELATGSGAVEPIVYVDDRLRTWADARTTQRLAGEVLPLPVTTWHVDSLTLEVAALAHPTRARVAARYMLRNRRPMPADVTLALAVRPFQVNPPTQTLAGPTGVASLGTLEVRPREVRVDGRMALTATPAATRCGAAAFDAGDVTSWLARGLVPPATLVRDVTGMPSGALAWRFHLGPGDSAQVWLELPGAVGRAAAVGGERSPAPFVRAWQPRLGSARLVLSGDGAEVARTAEAQAGWILANRTGPALQPGARVYARAWIRDGAVMADALLRMGRPDVARAFMTWFADHQYENGKVPCCVDRRGSDPVPEHDSMGELIWLVADYLTITRDLDTVRALWPHVRAAVSVLATLRAQRRTPEWRTVEGGRYFGLLPPSISHEGYSAKPMHSYWDDLWALRGYRDAAILAGRVSGADEAVPLSAKADTFARELAASVRAAMATHHIDYVPGCADLGDFDPTSTTIALDPVQAGDVLPEAAVRATFERYWRFARDRMDGAAPWQDFTPYEVRAIGAFVRLGWRERADSLTQFMLASRRPAGWRQWPEVVTRDLRTPHFLGDLPHAWVAADFLRSAISLLAYERATDDALVLAAGVMPRWLDAGPVGVDSLHVGGGVLSYRLVRAGSGLRLTLARGVRMPPGGIVLEAPGVSAHWHARADNGAPVTVEADGAVRIRVAPAVVTLTPD